MLVMTLSSSSPQPFPNLPGHPGVGVDVEGGDGAGEEGRGFKQPHFHVGTGVPPVVPVLVHTVVAQTREYAHALLETGREKPVHIPVVD